MRNDSAEILSVTVPILIKTGFSFFKSVRIYFAGTDYKSARSGKNDGDLVAYKRGHEIYRRKF
jgi:hypothetical protein